MYESGMTMQQIGDKYGKERWEVSEWVHESGAKVRKSGRPRKLPSISELRRLYVVEKLSSKKIGEMFGCKSGHKPVIAMLDRAGIPIRKSGPIKRDKCVKCWRPIKRVFHKKFRCWYGTMCAIHRRIHRVERAKWYTRERRNIHWKKWRYQSDIPEEVKRSPEYQVFLDEEREMQCLMEAKDSLREANKYLRHRGLSLSLRVG
jgi:hypothetical protein